MICRMRKLIAFDPAARVRAAERRNLRSPMREHWEFYLPPTAAERRHFEGRNSIPRLPVEMSPLRGSISMRSITQCSRIGLRRFRRSAARRSPSKSQSCARYLRRRSLHRFGTTFSNHERKPACVSASTKTSKSFVRLLRLIPLPTLLTIGHSASTLRIPSDS